MAIATSYNVLSTKGARENLENVMKTVSPQETPIYSTISQSAAPKATLNEWLVDFKEYALKNGISEITYNKSMSHVVFLPKVIGRAC